MVLSVRWRLPNWSLGCEKMAAAAERQASDTARSRPVAPNGSLLPPRLELGSSKGDGPGVLCAAGCTAGGGASSSNGDEPARDTHIGGSARGKLQAPSPPPFELLGRAGLESNAPAKILSRKSAPPADAALLLAVGFLQWAGEADAGGLDLPKMLSRMSVLLLTAGADVPSALAVA